MILTKCSVNSIDYDRLIEEKILGRRVDELLLIVPTNRKIRHFKKDLISFSPGKTTGAIFLETIETFSTKLLFSNSFSNRIISDPAAKVLLKQSFKETKLSFFSSYKTEIPDGTLERVRNVISEYKKHGITDVLLRKEAEKLETSEKLKAEDIANVFTAFNRRCKEIGVLETGDIYKEINSYEPQEFEARFRKLYPKVDLILIDGFDEFTMPETTIFNSLSNIKDSKLFIRFDYYPANNNIFSHLDDSYEKLLEKGFEKKEDTSFTPRKDFQELIRRSLFKVNTGEKNSKYQNTISEIKANNREKEVELITKEIKSLILEKKVEPHKICVVFNLIQQYSPIIRDQFKLNGIPFNLTDRYVLSTFSPVIEIISFLEVLENDFYYKDLFRVLGGTLFDKDEIDYSNLLQTAVKLKLVAGYENWVNKISDIKNALEREKSDNDYALRKLNLPRAINDLKTIKRKLEPFTQELTPGEFYQNIKKLIYERNVPFKILNGEEERREENIKSIEVFLETVQELIELFVLEYGTGKKFPLGFYLNNIRTAVKSARFNIKEKSNYGVLVTNLNEVRGLSFDYLFIAGLTDGDLPTRYSPEIFFSGSFVKNDIRHLTEERYHFYQSLCSWTKGLYLSYPEMDKKKELVKSNFLAEFLQLFSINSICDDLYKDNIYNREEILKIAGGKQRAGYEELIKENSLNPEEIENDIEHYNKKKQDPFSVFEGNGFISSKLSSEQKDELALRKEEAYSITQLEMYAQCPFRYFIERVLNLNEIEEPQEEIEAFELGSLIHDILFEFYTRVKGTELGVLSKNNGEFDNALKLLFEIAEEKITKSGFHSPFSFYEKERILGINGNNKESILYRFLEEERGRNPEFEPSFFEIEFGKPGSAAGDLKVNGINVTGKIDRVDVDNPNLRYKVLDYKLGGKKPKEDELLQGLSLQLPLYMLAVKELLLEKAGVEFEPAASEIYSLKLGNDFGSKPVLPKRSKLNYDNSSAEKRIEFIEYNDELIKICKESITRYVESISTGIFHITKQNNPQEKACKYCTHSSICRINELTKS